MCGIIGILSTTKKDVGLYIYDALTIIQHRGQDAAGITTANILYAQRKWSCSQCFQNEAHGKTDWRYGYWTYSLSNCRKLIRG